MMIHPNFFVIPRFVPARVWQAAKQQPTCLGDKKNAPGPTAEQILPQEWLNK